MRVGSNPQKKDFKVDMKSNHRIVMVIFIPVLEGYYIEMLNVIKLSINSLINTIPSTSRITIVDNGSCNEVNSFLIQLYNDKKIDSLQLHSENIGKIDALVGAARGVREPLITLTDCDILFKPNWVFETIKVFNAFKNVASVSPIPSRGSFNYFTYSTKEAILKNNLKLNFEPILENFEEFNLFLKSINWEIEKDETRPWPVVNLNNVKAIVGSDHQIVTIRRDILFNNSPKEPSFIKVGSQSEENYIDYAVDCSGLRLATYNFHAFHIGNTLENWMVEIANNTSEEIKEIPLIDLKPNLNYNSNNDLFYKIKKKLIKNIFKIKMPVNY